jgi:hypothetical protein
MIPSSRSPEASGRDENCEFAEVRDRGRVDGISIKRTSDILQPAPRFYPDDKPYPSRLLLGWVESRPIHVVTATAEHEIIVIRVYEPDPSLWEPGCERRRP